MSTPDRPDSDDTDPPDVHIGQALERRAAATPEAIAVRDGDRCLSYAALRRWSVETARALRRSGCARGDRVAIFLDKSAEQVVALYGVWLAGGVAVPIAPALKRQQLEHIVAHSQSRLLCSTPFKLRRAFADIPDSAALWRVPAQPDGEDAPAADTCDWKLPRPDELAAILYTSGSTGLPKGVVLSHDNLCAGARIVTGYLGLRPDDVIASVLPFSFDYGLNQLLCSVRVGAQLVLQRSVLSADIVRTLQRSSITVLAGVPTLWLQLLDPRSQLLRTPLPALRILTNSGGAFPPDAIAAYRRHLPGCQIFLMYGLTEAFRSAYLPPDQLDARPTSMGKAIPECELFVVAPVPDADHDGKKADNIGLDIGSNADNVRLVAPGEIGELVHRGPTVAQGYWRDPEMTARKFRPDPFDPAATRPVVYSGDLVRADDDGFLYFVGRRDQMIKAYGYRISPTEVEALVFRSGLVREVVVAGEPDPVAGARVVVHCVPGADFSPDALMAYCRREMPSYMLPLRIAVHDAFGRTGSGKIDRARVVASAESTGADPEATP